MNLCHNLWFLPYHGPLRLHPALQALIQECDVQRAAAGLLTPGASEAMRIKLDVAAEVARTSGGGGGGGGGRGG